MRTHSRFLVRPDTQPARFGRTPWGARNLAGEMATAPFVFSGLDEQCIRAIHDEFPDLGIEEPHSKPAAITFRVLRAPDKAFHSIPMRGWEYAVDLDYAPDEVTVIGPGFIAWAALGGANIAGSLWLSDSARVAASGIVLNVLRIALAYHWVGRGGCLLHSSAIIDANNGVHVFAGHSGAGKSTLGRSALAAGLRPLSDDLNLIIREGTDWIVHWLPFSGDLARQGKHPIGRGSLSAIYLLHPAESWNLHPLSPAAGAAALLACVPFLATDTWRGAQLLALMSNLAADPGVTRMEFGLESPVWHNLHILPR